MTDIPHCPSDLPSDISRLIHRLGKMWVSSESYPAIEADVCRSWRALIDEWIADKEIPLLVRKSSAIRGSRFVHAGTERTLIPCDNSPAQWVCNLALRGLTPSITEIKDGFDGDKIPVAFAHKKNEAAERMYHCTLGAFTVNKADWKLCHIKPVGLRVRQPLDKIDIVTLKDAFRKLVDPTNFFLVPKRWAGLGEAAEFIDGVIQNLKAEQDATLNSGAAPLRE